MFWGADFASAMKGLVALVLLALAMLLVLAFTLGALIF